MTLLLYHLLHIYAMPCFLLPSKNIFNHIFQNIVKILTVGRTLKVGLRTSSWTLDIFVISEPKWLKFGLQAHFFKMFGHAKFQLSITFTFEVKKLLLGLFSDFH